MKSLLNEEYQGKVQPFHRRYAMILASGASETAAKAVSRARSLASNPAESSSDAAEQVGRGPVIAFSWPFGAYGADSRTNDHAIAAINLRLAHERFALGFNDDGQDTYTLADRAGDPLRISRLRVDPTLTPRALFDRIELAIAASARTVQPDA